MTELEIKIMRRLFNARQMRASHSFGGAVADCRRVCIAPSPIQDLGLAHQFIAAYQTLYPEQDILLLRKEAGVRKASLGKVTEVGVGPQDQHLWGLWRSPQIQMLKQYRINLLIDLDIHFNPLYAFLCRRLDPAFRLCFAKPGSEDFYNLEYTGRPQAVYAERLQGLLQFLANLKA